MTMTMDELQDLQDSLSSAEGLKALSPGQREVLVRAGDIVIDLMGCQKCRGLGWYLSVESADRVEINYCSTCAKLSGSGEAMEAAVKFIETAREAALKVE